jgi:ubiquinone/menaquinone biosynthesis C-methylase UbiE
MIMEDLREQYSSSTNLTSRIRIHERYSVNKQEWHSWLLEQMHINANNRVLELGCGDGSFWYKNKGSIPKCLDVTLSDNFTGMLSDTKRNLDELFDFKYEQINIEEIPFEDDSFDVIIANHMLYHVLDRKKALKEVRRVLKTDGIFYCSTIGKTHLVEFGKLLKDFDHDLKYISANKNANEFGLENGEKQLRESFSKVSLKIFPDGLKITDVKAIIDYLISSNTNLRDLLVQEKLQSFMNYLEEHKLKNGGFINVTKSSGLFECR